MGIPYYRSFDYYTWIISMLLSAPVYYAFFATESLYKTFWDPIWDLDTEKIIRHKLYDYIVRGKHNTMDTVLDILLDLQLKCDAVDLILDKLIADEVSGYEELPWGKSRVIFAFHNTAILCLFQLKCINISSPKIIWFHHINYKAEG